MMKTCVYMTDPKVREVVNRILNDNVPEDLGVLFSKVDNECDLPYDKLARAMYIACNSGKDRENVKTLLKSRQALLKSAYIKGEIGVECLNRWMTEEEICGLTEIRDADGAEDLEE